MLANPGLVLALNSNTYIFGMVTFLQIHLTTMSHVVVVERYVSGVLQYSRDTIKMKKRQGKQLTRRGGFIVEMSDCGQLKVNLKSLTGRRIFSSWLKEVSCCTLLALNCCLHSSFPNH